MSIIGKKGEEVIYMPGFWETMMKLAVMLAVPVFTLGTGWAIWITKESFAHDQEIAVMRESLSSIRSRVEGVSSQMGKLPNKVAETLKHQDIE